MKVFDETTLGSNIAAPAKAGVQTKSVPGAAWIPAFAGMTVPGGSGTPCGFPLSRE